MCSLHYPVAIFPLLCNLSVNWNTNTKGLCVFAHRWQLIVCCEQFHYYYDLEPECKRPKIYLHLMRSCVHARWSHVLLEVEMVGKRIKWSLHGRNENVNSYYILYDLLFLFPSCRFAPTWFNIFLIMAFERRGPYTHHLSMLRSTYGKMISHCSVTK